jgi:RHS repeat-associated protein
MMRKKHDNIRLYHVDHLGSTSLVTDIDGEITQHVAYIPYGEIFVEQRNGSWNTPYLFNAKELDEETGLYYYGARYLDPTHAAWLSVDPLFEKYVGMTPYGYCAGNPVKMVAQMGKPPNHLLNIVGMEYSELIKATYLTPHNAR